MPNIEKNVICDYKKTEAKTFLKLVLYVRFCVFIFVNMTFVCVQGHNYGCWVKLLMLLFTSSREQRDLPGLQRVLGPAQALDRCKSGFFLSEKSDQAVRLALAVVLWPG